MRKAVQSSPERLIVDAVDVVLLSNFKKGRVEQIRLSFGIEEVDRQSYHI